MEDQFGKYLRLFGTIFFTVIGALVAFVLLLLGVRLLFGLLSYIPWLTYIYIIFIVLVPAVLFITCYIIYISRTRAHPGKAVRIISYALFSIALAAWAVVLVMDVFRFFKYAYTSIDMYYSYEMLFLAANVVCFFLVGIMQAFGMPKEKDWMERSRSRS